MLWLAPVVAIVSFQAAAGWEPVRETRNLKISASAGEPISVSTRNGAVSIVPTDGEHLIVTAELHAKTKEDLEKIQIGASNDTGKGSVVKVEFPDMKNLNGMGCSLRIEVPRARGVTVSTSNGPITVEGMRGESVLETSNGPVTIENHDGEVAIETSNAPVEASGVRGKLALQTWNGPVRVSLSDDFSERFSVETSNAPVEVSVPRSYNGVLGVQTSNARISFPADSNVTEAPSGKGWGTTNGSATFGKSGPVSSIETSNGNVNISYAGEPETPKHKKKTTGAD
jgi:ribosomal protein L6P/L9E